MSWDAPKERTLYAAGNPHVYEPVPPETAYTELDRARGRTEGRCAETRGPELPRL